MKRFFILLICGFAVIPIMAQSEAKKKGGFFNKIKKAVTEVIKVDSVEDRQRAEAATLEQKRFKYKHQLINEYPAGKNNTDLNSVSIPSGIKDTKKDNRVFRRNGTVIPLSTDPEAAARERESYLKSGEGFTAEHIALFKAEADSIENAKKHTQANNNSNSQEKKQLQKRPTPKNRSQLNDYPTGQNPFDAINNTKIPSGVKKK